MADQTPIGPEGARPVREDLQELARRLRQADRLGPDERTELAGLLEELAGAIDPAVSATLAAHLHESSTHMVQALDHEHDAGLIGSARDRLDAVASQAEAHAPVVTEVLRRLVNALGGIGA